MSRVQLALNVDDLDAGDHVLHQAVRHRPGQGQARLRQLRRRRAAAEAGAAGEPRPGRQHQPPRRRGRLQRQGARRDRPPDRRGAVHRRGDRHHLLLRHPGQGLGHRPRTARSGRSTPCSPTPRPSGEPAAAPGCRRGGVLCATPGGMLHASLGELLLTPDCLVRPAGSMAATLPGWRSSPHPGEQLQALRRESITVNIDVCRIDPLSRRDRAGCSAAGPRATVGNRRPSTWRRSSRRSPTRCGCGCSARSPATPAARPASATSPPAFDVSQPTISHHLKVLRDAGLLDVRASRLLGVLPRSSPTALSLARRRSCRSRRTATSIGGAGVTEHRADRPSTAGRRQALHPGPVPAGVDRRRDGRRPAAGPADPRPEHRAGHGCRSTASRCRSPSAC